MFTVSALEGNLSTRADVLKHKGDFRKIIKGVNDTLDAVIEPLRYLRIMSTKFVKEIFRKKLQKTIMVTLT